jgi:hypothetical protein
MITKAVKSFEQPWTSLFRPFSSSLWTASLIAMLSLSASLGVMLHHYAESGRNGLVQNICNSSFFVFSTFCGQGTDLTRIFNILYSSILLH